MLKRLGFGHAIRIQVEYDHVRGQRTVAEQEESVPIYFDGDSISGTVIIRNNNGSGLKHQGVCIELFGINEICFGEWKRDIFLHKKQELARPGILLGKTPYPFEFLKNSVSFESYDGILIKIKYYLLVTVRIRFDPRIKMSYLIFHRPVPQNFVLDNGDMMCSKCAIGFEFEAKFSKQTCHLHDVIFGQVHFLKVNRKLKNITLQLIRCEIISTVEFPLTILEKYEIMEGDVVHGDWVPFRLFLGIYPLSPTFEDLNGMFSIRYYIQILHHFETGHIVYDKYELKLYRVCHLSNGMSSSSTSNSTADGHQVLHFHRSNDELPRQLHPSIDNDSDALEMEKRSFGYANDLKKVNEVEVKIVRRDVLAGNDAREMDQFDNLIVEEKSGELSIAGLEIPEDNTAAAE